MSRRERELRLGVTGRRKVDVKGGCNAAGPFLSIISCPPRPGTRGDCCRLRTDPFWNGMTMSRKRLLVGNVGMEKMRREGWCWYAVESFSEPADGNHVVASA
jgi:hypothetical protein